jgi:hypothetical protein
MLFFLFVKIILHFFWKKDEKSSTARRIPPKSGGFPYTRGRVYPKNAPTPKLSHRNVCAMTPKPLTLPAKEIGNISIIRYHIYNKV